MESLNLAKPAQEFSAVILAGSSDSTKLHPLTSQTTPKPLLPIANRPLLAFQLELLERAGFDHVFVIAERAVRDEITNAVEKEYKQICNGKISVDLIELDDAQGSADALRRVSSKLNITNDFFVLSGDVVTNIPIAYVAGLHRYRSATMTMLLRAPAPPMPAPAKSEPKEKGKGKGKDKDKEPKETKEGKDTGSESLDEHLMAVDDKTGRVVYCRSMGDLDSDVELHKAVLRQHPNTVMSSRLEHAYIYLMAPSVFALLESNPRILSIQTDLVPYLVANQFVPDAQGWAAAKAGASGPVDLTEPLAMSHAAPLTRAGESAVRVYAYVAQHSAFLERCVSVDAYVALNRHIKNGTSETDPWTGVEHLNGVQDALRACPKAAITDSLLGQEIKLEPATIKDSIVGSHCRISMGCLIERSIVMDHVVLEGKVKLINTVVGKNCVIRAGAELRNCRVGDRSVVEGGEQYAGSVFEAKE